MTSLAFDFLVFPYAGDDVLTLTATTTSDPQTITLQRITPTGADCVVTWGDGTQTTIADGETGATAHEYATAGTYTITLENPSVLTWIDVSSTATLSGNISNWVLPDLLTNLLVDATNVSGDISGWTLPASLANLSLNTTVLSGDISNWALPTGQRTVSIYSTDLTDTPIVSGNTSLRTYQYNDCSLAQANVDAVLLSIYNQRASFTFATPALNVGGDNSVPSGVYQYSVAPSTGLEYVYALANDDDGEGFNTWSITYNGGTAP